MSVLFLPPPSASSIPDASETVKGKIRIATSAEATTGSDDLTAMTPAKVKSVVDAAVVGGVEYKGTFDAAAPADLSNAEQGDLYIISGAGTYQGQVWAVGDHLLINADMGGTLDSAKIDKVDNTDAVTSVAGRTGAVTLSTADISGLATVASTGAYSDLSGTPSLATVATTGAYSDLSGTPTLGTAAAEDVGTSAGNVVQLDGTAKLPAVDGSQLTNLPNGTLFYKTQIASLGPTLSQITDNRRQHYDVALANPSNPITLPAATSAAVGGVVSFFNSDGVNQAVVNSPTARLLSGSSVTSFTVEPYEARSFVWVGASSLQEITATRLDHFNGVSITSPSNGEALIYNSTSGAWENSTVSATVAALDDIGDVNAPTPADTNVLKYNSTSGDWEDGAVAASEVSGLATVATTGAYSDLSGTPTNVSTFTNDAGYLTGITGQSLNDLSDVSFSAGPGIDNYVLTYDDATNSWGAEAAAGGGGTAPTVSVSSPSTDQTLSSPSAGVIEEVYVYTPSVDITVNLVAAATCGSGFKYQIKNMSTNVITIDPNSSETVDGSSTFLLNAQYESATLITDGSNWFVI